MTTHVGGILFFLLIGFNIQAAVAVTNVFVIEYGLEASAWPSAAIYYGAFLSAVVAALGISIFEVGAWLYLIERLETPLTSVAYFRHQSHEEIFLHATLLAPLNFMLLWMPIHFVAVWMQIRLIAPAMLFVLLPVVIALGILELGYSLLIWRKFRSPSQPRRSE